ncbi:two-component response regulator [Lachnospiraceae bacterium KM106-2]|nr:two-component response regulator [Lachnospiraceae bacterium KM106-2]
MNILIVEDDQNLNRGISFAMEKEGYRVYSAFSIRSAKEIQSKNEIEFIILDLNLPDGDGLDYCGCIRQNSDIPIIMLTARDMETDEVLGLEYGADDYLTKPFSLAVLKARISTIVRRQSKKEKDKIIQVLDFELDMKKMQISKDHMLLDLTLTEYKLLSYFIENTGRVLTKEQILAAIWDVDGNYVDENTLQVNIRRLRKKIGKEDRIETVFGVGYCFARKGKEG